MRFSSDAPASAELWTASMAAAADRYTIDTLGIPSDLLMERAALAVSAEVQSHAGGLGVTVLCGPGNNGADGVAVARILVGRGLNVQAYTVADSSSLVLARQIAWARAVGVPVQSGLPTESAEGRVIVDALLGTGSRGTPRGMIAEAIEWAWSQSAPTVAVDLPSGVDPDTGAVLTQAVRATMTVTFQRSKPGLHVLPGRGYSGRVVVGEIGLLAPVGSICETFLLDPVPDLDRLSALPAAQHKGHRGHVGVVAGSRNTPGAAVLVGTAALRVGAGLVTVCSDDPQFRTAIVAFRPELMAAPKDAEVPAGVWVIGPGLTDSEDQIGLGARWRDDPSPSVWDASALDSIDGPPLTGVRVITPHPGEAARVLTRLSGESWTSARVQASRLVAAGSLERLTGAIVVLKGEGTIVRYQGQTYISTSGNDALATAGSGDVLAGAIGGLIARGLAPIEAARLAVHIHGSAGESVGAGGLALDIADRLPNAMRNSSDPMVRGPHWPVRRLE